MDENTQQAAVFLTLVVGIALILLGSWALGILNSLVLLIIVLGVLVILYTQLPNFFAEIAQYERAVVFRMGKFRKVAKPGWLFVIPFIESFEVVDLREETVDLEEQHVVTEDNIELQFSTVLFIKVKNARKAVIEIKDYHRAARARVQARLRGIAGNMKMTEIVSHIDRINEELLEYMEQVEDRWGVTFTNVEIQSVDIPERIQKAVQDRRAATEVKEKKIEEARGKKGEIDQIREAADKLGSQALQYYYLQALEKISEGKSSKIIFPLELSKLAGSLSNSLPGLDFGEAQETLMDRYQELRKKGKDKESVIEELKKEVDKGKIKEKVKKKEKEDED